MRVTGRILLIITIVITAVSTLFCIIGLSTNGWGGYGSNSLFCSYCPQSSKALSILAFILLLITILALFLHMFDIIRGLLRYIPFILLLISSIFLLGTIVGYVRNSGLTSYSYDLMVVAHFFAYMGLVVLAYWYGELSVTSASSG
jgi:hypothetical protein